MRILYWAICILFFMFGNIAIAGKSSGASSRSISSGSGTGSTYSSKGVSGYTKKNGAYVAPHQRSTPDTNLNNNWSSKPNVNPYTGKQGTQVNPTTKNR
jgi:hypothetical protein